MQEQLIITHPGGAHFDEMTAIALVLAVHADASFRIERREPSLADIEDPGVWIIDVGNRHQPEKRNFDHHQDAKCPAAFILVAQHLELEETMSVMPWWDFKDSVDRIGPVASSAKFQAGDDLVNRNPVETWLTSRFAAAPQETAPLLKDYGEHLIAGARLLKSQLDVWKSGRRLMITDVPAIIAETTESAGLEEFRRLEKDKPDIVISLDRRDKGWRLFRYDGAPVDFTRITNHPEIAFPTRTGFWPRRRSGWTQRPSLPWWARLLLRVS